MAYHLKNKPEKWIKDTRALGFDHGTKTFGLALSNSDQTIVTPLETIHRTKWAHDKQVLDKIIQDNDVQSIVVGYPLNMDGSAGERCQAVKDFVSLMEETWPNVTIFFFDERLSTQTVDKFLDNNRKMTRGKRKEFKDALAAQVILDEALRFLELRELKNGMDTSD